jgi:PhnB protein
LLFPRPDQPERRTLRVDAGASVVMPLDDMFWGDRYGQVKDPFGHQWSIGTPIKGDTK